MWRTSRRIRTLDRKTQPAKKRIPAKRDDALRTQYDCFETIGSSSYRLHLPPPLSCSPHKTNSLPFCTAFRPPRRKSCSTRFRRSSASCWCVGDVGAHGWRQTIDGIKTTSGGLHPGLPPNANPLYPAAGDQLRRAGQDALRLSA